MPAPTLTAVTTPQNNGSNTLAVNMPGSVVATDLLVVVLSHGGTNVNMPGTNPWHKKFENSNSVCVAYLRGSEHIANGSPATYSFTTGGVSSITNAFVAQIAGAIGTGDPFDVTTTAASTAVTTSGSCTVVTTVADVYLLNADFKSAARTLSVAPTGMTQRAGGAGNSFTHVFDSTQAVAGSSGAKQSTYTVGSSHSSTLLAVKPVSTQTVSPSGFDLPMAYGTPTLVPGVATVSPSGFTLPMAYGTPTLVPGQAVAHPAGFDLLVTFGTPTLTPSSVSLHPTGFDLPVTFGTPTVVPGVTRLEPDGFDLTVEFGTPTLLQLQVVAPSGFDLPVVFGTPALETQPVITARVFDHETGNPVGPGVSVCLFDSDNVQIDCTTTDANSDYTFHLPFGTTGQFWTLVRVSDTVQGASGLCEPT